MARGLLNDPWILFLDEPTLGLDVAAARVDPRARARLEGAPSPGRTVLLTTHYMAEADELCERIAIVDHGRILAIGTPDELKKRVQRESIFRLELDRLDGGIAGARPAARASVSAALAADIDPELQRVAVNLVLEEDARAGRRGHGAGRHRAATSSPCASPSPRSRTCSSSWSAAGSATTGRRRRRRERRSTGGPTRTEAPRRDDEADGVEDLRPRPAPTRPRRPTRGGAPMTAGTRPRRPRRRARVDLRLVAQRHRPAHRVGRGRAARSLENNARALVGRAYPARPGHGPRAVVAVLRDPAAVPDDVGVRPRLPRPQAPEAYVGFVVLGGAMAAFWLNVVWMMAGQLYWEKSQGNLELYFAAPDEPDVDPAGDGRRRADHELDARGRDPRHLHDRVRGHVRRRAVAPAHRRVLPDAVRAVRPGDDAREPVPAVGPRGVPHDQRDDRARVLRVGAQLPGRAAGRARRARDRHDPVRRRASTRCASSCSRASRTSPARRRPRSRR